MAKVVRGFTFVTPTRELHYTVYTTKKAALNQAAWHWLFNNKNAPARSHLSPLEDEAAALKDGYTIIRVEMKMVLRK